MIEQYGPNPMAEPWLWTLIDRKEWADLTERLRHLPVSELSWTGVIAISDMGFKEIFDEDRAKTRLTASAAHGEPSSWEENLTALHELEQALAFKAINSAVFTVLYVPKGDLVPVNRAREKIVAPIRCIVTDDLELVVHEACHLMTCSRRDSERINYDLDSWIFKFSRRDLLDWYDIAGVEDNNLDALNFDRKNPRDESTPTFANYKELIATVLEHEVYAKACEDEVKEYGRETFFRALHRGFTRFGGNIAINLEKIWTTELKDMPSDIRIPVEEALTKHADAFHAAARLIGHTIDWGTAGGFTDMLNEQHCGR